MNESQWNWRWVVGLVATGIIIFILQQTFALPSRVSVLENELGNRKSVEGALFGKLERMENKIDQLQRDLNEIEREVKKK